MKQLEEDRALVLSELNKSKQKLQAIQESNNKNKKSLSEFDEYIKELELAAKVENVWNPDLIKDCVYYCGSTEKFRFSNKNRKDIIQSSYM